MLRQFVYSPFIKVLLFAVIAVQLVACNSSSDDSASIATASGAVEDNVVLTGSVGDGPVIGATIEVWSSSGRLVKTLRSDNTASFKSRIRVRRSYYPLLLKVTGGIDLVTGREPDFQMVSVMLDRRVRRVNINPFSTLMVKIAQSLPGGINADNIRTAQGMVMDTLGFGLDPGVFSDPISSKITDGNTAGLLKASEAMGEMIRRTRDLITATGRKASGDAVMAAIAADMQDGVLDGRGTNGTDPRITAASKVVSSQVLVEALSNTLKVGGVVATSVIDQAIVVTRPGIGSNELTQSVRVTDGLLQQAQAALAAARVLDSSAEVTALGSIVSGIRAGSLPNAVETILPADSSRSLDNAVLLASTADAAQIAAVNTAENQTGSEEPVPADPVPTKPVPIDPVPTDPVPTDPVPTDPVPTKPVPTDPVPTDPVPTDPVPEPVPTDPVPTDPVPTDPVPTDPVPTDPVPTDPVPTDPVPTDPVPVNNPPVISGEPVPAVEAGVAYSFQPVASDADGDELTFSITNLPAWAGFDRSTGRLSGTPVARDVRIYDAIIITVSDGVDTATLPPFSISVDSAPVTVGSFSLIWTAPVTRADGSPLSLADIGGYRIHYGASTGNYPNTLELRDGSVQQATVNDLPLGTYHVVMTSYDTSGRESANSAEVVKVVR